MNTQQRLASITTIREVRSVLYGMSPERQVFELNTALQELYLSSELHIAEHRDIQAIHDLSRMSILEDCLVQAESRIPKREVVLVE